MTKTLLEIINLKKSYEHRNGIVDLFENVNIKILNKFGSLSTEPPTLITISSFLYLLKYFATSSTEGPFEGKIFSKFTSSIFFIYVVLTEVRFIITTCCAIVKMLLTVQ